MPPRCWPWPPPAAWPPRVRLPRVRCLRARSRADAKRRVGLPRGAAEAMGSGVVKFRQALMSRPRSMQAWGASAVFFTTVGRVSSASGTHAVYCGSVAADGRWLLLILTSPPAVASRRGLVVGRSAQSGAASGPAEGGIRTAGRCAELAPLPQRMGTSPRRRHTDQTRRRHACSRPRGPGANVTRGNYPPTQGNTLCDLPPQAAHGYDSTQTIAG